MEIQERIKGCELCLRDFPDRMTKPPPMQRGGHTGGIMVIGLEPGNTETNTGKAFSGPTGKTLRGWLTRIGLDDERIESEVYMTSLLKCNSGGKLHPKMIGNCAPILDDQIALVKPRLVLLLGVWSIQEILGFQGTLKEIVGMAYRESSLNLRLFTRFPEGTSFVPLPHPSPISPWYKQNGDLLDRALGVLAELVGVRA